MRTVNVVSNDLSATSRSVAFEHYFRYYEGLVNINPLRNIWVGVDGESQFLDFTEKNRSFQFGIEYKLMKKQKKEKQYGRKYAKPH